MSTAEFRIEYTIQRAVDDGEFKDVGFGSSSTWDTVAEALYAVESDIQNQNWETAKGMPKPSELEAEES